MSVSRRKTNSREESIHCRVIVAISRKSTGLSSNSRRKPPVFHFDDKLIVARQAGGLARRRQIVPCFARLPCLGKAFVDRRSGKPGESLEKRHAQASVSGFAEVVERPFADAGPEHRVGMFDYGSEQMFEAQGSVHSELAATLPLAVELSAASIQIASAIQAGGADEARRRTVANLSSTQSPTDRRAPAAGQIATNRRSHRTGTTRLGGERPNQHHPSAQGALRTHRTGVRRWLQRE